MDKATISESDEGILYLNFSELAFEMDASELVLKLLVSHLVHKGIFAEITSLYSEVKVGRVDEKALSAYTNSLVKTRQASPADEKSTISEDLEDFASFTDLLTSEEARSLVSGVVNAINAKFSASTSKTNKKK
jgi:hypothetical protein